MLVTLKELPSGEKAVRQMAAFRCELWNETDKTVRVYLCNPETLEIHLLNPREVRRDVWLCAGHNALCAFDVCQQVCIQAGCFHLSGPVCILIGPKTEAPTTTD